jgi:hypothetical protein
VRDTFDTIESETKFYKIIEKEIADQKKEVTDQKKVSTGKQNKRPEVEE